MLKVEAFSLPPLNTNCYILTDEKTQSTAVIDFGYPDEELIGRLVGLGEKLKYILLTHSHFDHILGVKKLKDSSCARVAVHALDADGLEDKSASMFEHFSAYYPFKQESVKADILLSDGDELDIGEYKIKVLETAGHTDGSVCFLVDNLLFSGDTLFKGSMGRVDFPTSNPSDMAESLRRLAALEGDYTVYAGHDAPTTLENERKYNIYLKQAENGTLYA